MVLCVAEKPSVGQYIASVLGANTRRDGYFEGNGYWVSWTFGHLCSLLEPQDYGDQWKGWNLSSLPMIPERFGIKLIDDKGVQKQFDTLKSLIAQCTEVINCGDAGQEGELIQRWVYQKAGCRVPVRRLWVNSLTEEAIREGFRALQDQSHYQSLYEAGLMRAIGDWLLGMNATRAYTLRYRQPSNSQRPTTNDQRRTTSTVLSVGRVQTPTLALIVRRQQEIEHFVPKTYYVLRTVYRDTTFSALAPKDTAEDDDPNTLWSISSPEEAQAVLESIQGQPLTITSVEKKKGVEYAPRLFDLTSLQVECNKRFSMSADDTLKIIQSLYEKRITTYPRVDTTYLSDDIYPKVPATLKGISDYYPQANPLLGQKLPKSKRVFDNKKVTDHHAIIPTGQRPDNLTSDERRVFDLVALRFIAAFYPDCQVANTTVLAEISTKWNEEKENVNYQLSIRRKQIERTINLRVTGRQILVPGWRAIFTDSDEEDSSSNDQRQTTNDPQSTTNDQRPTTNDQNLPAFTRGESGPHTPALQEKTTTPPKYYTEATLLRAMETAGKTVDNEELRDAMKENGIGRPSTRAAIIEKLFQRDYIVRQGKSLRATPLGIELIATIISPLLKSAELTGLWEQKLRRIERGEFTAQQFLDELKQMTSDVVRQVKTDQAGCACPVCRQGRIIRGRTRYGCSRWREGCSFAAPFEP